MLEPTAGTVLGFTRDLFSGGLAAFQLKQPGPRFLTVNSDRRNHGAVSATRKWHTWIRDYHKCENSFTKAD